MRTLIAFILTLSACGRLPDVNIQAPPAVPNIVVTVPTPRPTPSATPTPTDNTPPQPVHGCFGTYQLTCH